MKERLQVCAILLAFGVISVGAIKCFQCSSQRDPGCAELSYPTLDLEDLNMTTTPLYYRECDQHYHDKEPFCRKISQTIFARDQLKVVTRSCGWEKHPRLSCYEFENKGHAEVVCQCFEDGCNLGVHALTTPVLILFLAITLLHIG